MIETYYCGVYWGPRRESLEECSRRSIAFLQCLRQLSPHFARWFKRGKSRKNALLQEVEPKIDEVQHLLLAGRNRADYGGEVIEDLGFRMGLWNGKSDAESVGFNILCGCYAKIPGINSCIIDLPSGGRAAQDILQVPMLIEIIKCAASSWDADWGIVTSNILQHDIANVSNDQPRSGWIVYLSSHYTQPTWLPPLSRKVPLGDLGLVIVTTDQRFSASNSEHVKTAKSLAKILEHIAQTRQ